MWLATWLTSSIVTLLILSSSSSSVSTLPFSSSLRPICPTREEVLSIPMTRPAFSCSLARENSVGETPVFSSSKVFRISSTVRSAVSGLTAV